MNETFINSLQDLELSLHNPSFTFHHFLFNLFFNKLKCYDLYNLFMEDYREFSQLREIYYILFDDSLK